LARQLLDTHQAAELLGCGVHKIQRLVREGFLRAVDQPGPRHAEYRFDRDELEAYRELRREAVSLPQVARWAMQARAQSSALLRRVDELHAALGLELELLDPDPTAARELYREALATAEQAGVPPAAAIARWARVLHGLNDQYLDIIATTARTPEPWLAYLRVADNILASVAPRTQYPELADVCSALELGRRHALAVAYFYVRTRLGVRVADQNFLTGYVDDEVLALMRDC
jgi:excisionase family DNA binding protein